MNNPFDYRPHPACDEAFAKLLHRIEALHCSGREEDANFCRELDAGKMLGVLVACDAEGQRHTLYAFSGQLGKGGFHFPGFVEPVMDYLSPEGYFKTREREITAQNKEITHFEQTMLPKIRSALRREEECLGIGLESFKEICRRSKQQRDARRAAGGLSEADLAAMIRQSQFEKAELRRLKKRIADTLAPSATELREAEARLKSMKERRRADSEDLQQWLFSNFQVLNALGQSKSLTEIFADTAIRIPPSGAGECCAPKLLQAAYRRGLQPVAIAEYWYGNPKDGEIRIHGSHYPACRGKCLPVLRWMLKGLAVNPPLDSESGAVSSCEPEIIYENEWFCVVNKPSGILSVPGKGTAGSVQSWLEEKYGLDKKVRVAHRLDRDTSGLIIAAFGDEAYKLIQSLFATRKVKKTYIAELEGDYQSLGIPREGRIELPLSPDWLDRPRQRVDLSEGKEAVTDYKFITSAGTRSRVMFRPRTGRTHQLRVHAASEQGLGMPIAGDPLYGKDRGSGAERLMLHAAKIEFTFPITGRAYTFKSPLPF